MQLKVEAKIRGQWQTIETIDRKECGGRSPYAVARELAEATYKDPYVCQTRIRPVDGPGRFARER